jgi:hypothetical protein
MNGRNKIRTAIVIALLSLAAATAAVGAEKMGTSRGHDLDALWARAQKEFGTSAYDAIMLLESRHETILDGGGRRTIVHRVVWIGTSPGLHDHADLRIPWNSAVSTFKVHILRTWRDGRWWPHESEVSPTAVVETLPFAVASADDYSAMREAMLLHDGVELPCIMETAYEIEEQPGAAGYDGFFVMRQNDPAVKVELRIDAPAGASLEIRGYNGAPVPEQAGGGETRIVTMEGLEPLGSPRIDDPAVYAPCVAWSTWKSWGAVRDAVMKGFDGAAIAGPELTVIIAARINDEPSDAAKARKAAGLVNELTNSVHYDSRYWGSSPRPASRTYETAYGHALDRAVLAAAIFRGAGLKAEPVYVSSGPSGVDAGLPGLARFGEMRVCVHSETFRGIYDPYEGALSEGPRAVYGRMAWKPASDEAPWSYPPAGEAASNCRLTMTLEPGEDGGWKGTGYVDADGIFCPFADMAGLEDEAKAAIGQIAGSVLPGAEVTGYNPEVFEKTHVTAGFAFTIAEAEPDGLGRRSIVIGDPHGGVADAIPADVRLYHERRTSPVVLPGAMSQTVKIRFKAPKKSILQLPEARALENAAGSFRVRMEMKDGWVTVDRTLKISGGTVGPESWPLLRALLLEAEDRAGRTVLME